MKKSKVPELSEKMFQSRIVAGARALGFMVYHTYDSRRSTKGFPDLCLVHPKSHQLIFLEIKTDKGRVSLEQATWISALEMVLGNVHALILRPQLWDVFWEELKRWAK